MIDTDKYEGHTEGPWRIVEGDSIYDENEYWLAIRSAKGFDVTELSGTTSDIGKSDWNLIADAPLLLAEVKRLSEIEQEWLVMWATLEELNLVADVRKNMTLHGFVFPTDEDMEGDEEE
tara:strand:+ start:158 stop:514 length:357 start_codon:yes stop_codon:yes gene_type:complete